MPKTRSWYRVQHKRTRYTHDVWATTPAQACDLCGWSWRDCWVRGPAVSERDLGMAFYALIGRTYRIVDASFVSESPDEAE